MKGSKVISHKSKPSLSLHVVLDTHGTGELNCFIQRDGAAFAYPGALQGTLSSPRGSEGQNPPS